MSASHKKITNESQMNSEKIKNSDFSLPGVKKIWNEVRSAEWKEEQDDQKSLFPWLA